MRGRKRTYIDIVLNEAKIKRLCEGYTISVVVNKQAYAIAKEVADPVQAKINELKTQIKELEAQVDKPKKLFRIHDVAKPKRKLSPEALERLRQCAAHARAAKAARRANV